MGYYDGMGIYREDGSGGYDAEGYYREPGQGGYDYKGYYRSPGDGGYDAEGYYRELGDGGYDSKGFYRANGWWSNSFQCYKYNKRLEYKRCIVETMAKKISELFRYQQEHLKKSVPVFICRATSRKEI